LHFRANVRVVDQLERIEPFGKFILIPIGRKVFFLGHDPNEALVVLVRGFPTPTEMALRQLSAYLFLPLTLGSFERFFILFEPTTGELPLSSQGISITGAGALEHENVTGISRTYRNTSCYWFGIPLFGGDITPGVEEIYLNY
jgi:hypothetical protein